MATGVVYLVLGVGGFLFAENGELVGFGAGALLNLVRTVIGVAGIVAAFWTRAPRVYGWGLFLALAGFTVFGVLTVATGQAEDANSVLRLHSADSWLHGATALIGLGVGFLPDRRV